MPWISFHLCLRLRFWFEGRFAGGDVVPVPVVVTFVESESCSVSVSVSAPSLVSSSVLVEEGVVPVLVPVPVPEDLVSLPPLSSANAGASPNAKAEVATRLKPKRLCKACRRVKLLCWFIGNSIFCFMVPDLARRV